MTNSVRSVATPAPIVVAGHLCLDIIPQLGGDLPGPGALQEVGDATLSLGGAVSNVGLALHRLGRLVRLVGAVGEDGFGTLVREKLRNAGEALDDHLQSLSDSSTSYSVVLSPPGIDRSFLHCPGVNHGFDPADVSDDVLGGASLLHFGYPPLMKKIWKDGGAALSDLFVRAKKKGLTTSLDLAMPDANGASGGVDWPAFFNEVLPHVDLFVPSIDETRVTLGLPARAMEDESDLSAIADDLLGRGAKAVVLKLGEHGLYLRTAEGFQPDDGRPDPDAWSGRELLLRCLKVDVAGTTGAGDCTIAGFLYAYTRGDSPIEAMQWATAVGACSVEVNDATGGIPAAEAIANRLEQDWPRHDQPAPPGWANIADHPGLHAGPSDVRKA